MKKKILSLAASVVFGISLLAGCGSGSSDSANASAGNGDGTSAPAAVEKIGRTHV